MGRKIDTIGSCPRFHSFPCAACGAATRARALQIYARCPGCGAHHKCRGFGEIGSEVQDTTDAVLE